MPRIIFDDSSPTSLKSECSDDLQISELVWDHSNGATDGWTFSCRVRMNDDGATDISATSSPLRSTLILRGGWAATAGPIVFTKRRQRDRQIEIYNSKLSFQRFMKHNTIFFIVTDYLFMHNNFEIYLRIISFHIWIKHAIIFDFSCYFIEMIADTQNNHLTVELQGILKMET